MCPNTLLPVLESLSEQCEIVFFTWMPLKVIETIINKCIPQAKKYISLMLGHEQMTFSEDGKFAYKDIHLLDVKR